MTTFDFGVEFDVDNSECASNNQQRKMSNVLSCDNSIGKSVAATVLDVPKINNTCRFL